MSPTALANAIMGRLDEQFLSEQVCTSKILTAEHQDDRGSHIKKLKQTKGLKKSAFFLTQISYWPM